MPSNGRNAYYRYVKKSASKSIAIQLSAEKKKLYTCHIMRGWRVKPYSIRERIIRVWWRVSRFDVNRFKRYPAGLVEDNFVPMSQIMVFLVYYAAVSYHLLVLSCCASFINLLIKIGKALYMSYDRSTEYATGVMLYYINNSYYSNIQYGLFPLRRGENNIVKNHDCQYLYSLYVMLTSP